MPPLKKIPKGQRAFSIVIAVLVLMAFSMIVAYLGSMMGAKNDAATTRLFANQALAEAESGAEVGMREIRNEKNGPLQSTSPFQRSFGSGESSFDALNTTGSNAASNPDDALSFDPSGAEKFCNLNNAHPLLQVNNYSSLGAFTGSGLLSVKVYIKQRRQGQVSNVDVSYSTDGGTNWTYLFTFQPTVGWSFITPFTVPVDWTTVNASSFSLKLQKSSSGGSANIDYIGLYADGGGTPIDTNTEPWRSNSYITLPKNFSGGQIVDILTEDEAGKVNLNTANQALLHYLLAAYGVADATADTAATNIVNYRTANGSFKNVEELMQVSGMTSAIYNAATADPESRFNGSGGTRKMYQDCTVYSWINVNAQRPAAQRAPVNINTASTEVLRAVFDPLVSTYLSAAHRDSLVSDIRTQRAAATFPTTAPFSLMFTSYPATNQFAAFLDARSYLTAGERLNLKENADPSSKDWGSSLPGGNVLSTEFCHTTNVFMLQGTGKATVGTSTVQRIARVVFGDVYYSATAVKGSLKVPVTTSETGYSGYWREQ